METFKFVAKNSGGVKKKPVIYDNLKRVYFFSFLFQQAAPATGRRARIHTEIREQPSFSIKL